MTILDSSVSDFDCDIPGAEDISESISDDRARELLSQYEMQFELLLDEPSAVEHFTYHLRRNLNQEPLLFTVAVRNVRLAPEEDKLVLINSIYEEYIREGAASEINIDAIVRRDIKERLSILQTLVLEAIEKQRESLDRNSSTVDDLKKESFSKTKPKESFFKQAFNPRKRIDEKENLLRDQSIEVIQIEEPSEPKQLVKPTNYNIFEDVQQIILRELKEDAFPRYVRSQDFFEFIKLKGVKMIQLLGKNITQEGRNALVYRPRDFKSDAITDKDIIFILKLNEDSLDWEPLRKAKRNMVNREYYTYISKTSYAIGDQINGLQLGKITGTLPFSAEEVLRSIVRQDTSKLWDANSTHWEQVDYQKIDSRHPYACCHTDYEMSTGVPMMHHRYSLQLSTVVYDTERKCYIWVGKSLDQPLARDTSHMVKADFLYGYTLYKINSKKMRYVHCVYADLKNNMISSLFRTAMKKRETGLHQGFMQVCKLAQENGFPRPQNDCGLLTSLDDFMAKYLSTDSTGVKTWDISKPSD
jgi:hypothetical protein